MHLTFRLVLLTGVSFESAHIHIYVHICVYAHIYMSKIDNEPQVQAP